MMDLQTLIKQWFADTHPDITIDRGVACLPINSPHLKKDSGDHVWYVCRVGDDRVFFFNPAKEKFGPDLVVGLPTFFEQLNAVIEFYRAYTP
jgi:hypothetical protein